MSQIPPQNGSAQAQPGSTGPWRYPARPGLEPSSTSQPPPGYRDFFNEVWLELIDLPPVSDRALSLTQTGLRVTAPVFARNALDQMARSHPLHLRPSFVAPEGTPHLAFPMENGCCDVIRARYRAAPYFVDLAYANLIFAIRVVGDVRRPGEPALDVAQRMAALVFDDELARTTPITFIQVGNSDGLDTAAPAYGCHDIGKASYSVYSPHWVNLLCWWIRPDEVGFISMWGEGERKRAVDSPSAEANRRWFSPKAK
jgi:hypothetical protein